MCLLINLDLKTESQPVLTGRNADKDRGKNNQERVNTQTTVKSQLNSRQFPYHGKLHTVGMKRWLIPEKDILLS